MKQHKYISICRGEAQINIDGRGNITLAGPYNMDPTKLLFMCKDGLQEKMNRLNAELDLCCDAMQELEERVRELGK